MTEPTEGVVFDAQVFSAFLTEAAEYLERSTEAVREALGSRAIDEAMVVSISNNAAAMAEAAATLIGLTDDHVAVLEEEEKQKAKEAAPLDLFDDEYMLELVEHFMLRGVYTTKALRIYLEDTEDFTDEEIRRLTLAAGNERLLTTIADRMRLRGERPYVYRDGKGRDKEFSLVRLGEPTHDVAQGEQTREETAPTRDEAESQTRGLPQFSVTEMAQHTFVSERMTEEQKEAVQSFIKSLFNTPREEVLSRELKRRVVELLNNKLIGVEEAQCMLDKAYQAYLIGKKERDEQVYFVADVTQRRTKRQRIRSQKPELAAESQAINYVEEGVEHIFDALVGTLTHVQQKMTPDEISKIIQESGAVVSSETIKRVTRALDDYFETGEFSKGKKSPHAKSRAQKIFMVGLKGQTVKDAWRNNRVATLNDIDARHLDDLIRLDEAAN